MVNEWYQLIKSNSNKLDSIEANLKDYCKNQDLVLVTKGIKQNFDEMCVSYFSYLNFIIYFQI